MKSGTKNGPGKNNSSSTSYWMFQYPPCLFSIRRSIGKMMAENANVSSWPMFAPLPISDAIGAEYHVTCIPRAAPMNPKQKAPTDAHPNGRAAGLFQASKSYADHRRRKIKCSSITTVAWITVQYPMTLRKVCRASSKYLAAQQPTMTATTDPNVTSTVRGIWIAHVPRFWACKAKE